MKRRGVEMSMSLLVIIVICLVVLALMIYIVTTNVRKGNSQLNGCRENGGQCGYDCGSGESTNVFFTGGCQDDEFCCIPESRMLGENE